MTVSTWNAVLGHGNRRRLVTLAALCLSLLGLASCGADVAPFPAERTVADAETPPQGSGETQGYVTPPILDETMGTKP
jgi:hypothetical protein